MVWSADMVTYQVIVALWGCNRCDAIMVLEQKVHSESKFSQIWTPIHSTYTFRFGLTYIVLRSLTSSVNKCPLSRLEIRDKKTLIITPVIACESSRSPVIVVFTFVCTLQTGSVIS